MGPVICVCQRLGAIRSEERRQTHLDGLGQLLGQRSRPFPGVLVVLFFFLGSFPQLCGRRRKAAVRGRGPEREPRAGVCRRGQAGAESGREFRCWTPCRAPQRAEHGGPHVAQFQRPRSCTHCRGRKEEEMAIYSCCVVERCRLGPIRCVTLNSRSRHLLSADRGRL